MAKINLDAFDKAVADTSMFEGTEEDTGTSGLKSAGLGALQGASFGFADEAEALARAAVQDKTYDQLLMEVRQRYKEAEEANPMSYMAGNIGGGFVVPGVGAAGGIMKGLSVPARMLLTGAGSGALTSVGTQEGDKLSTQTLADAAQGAAIGGGLGVALGSALPAMTSKLAKVAKNTEAAEDIADVFKKIKSGQVETFGREALPEFAQKVRDAAKNDILDNVGTIDKGISGQYKTLMADADRLAQDSNKNIAIDKIIEELRPKLADAELRGASESGLNALNKNFGKMLGEETIEREVVSNLDPITELLRAQTKLTPKVAQGEATNRGIQARNMLRSLEESGATPEMIDQMEAAMMKHGMIDSSRMPQVVKDPTTGMDILQARRADADLNMAIPTQKMEKIKEVIPTRTELSPSDMNTYINNLQELANNTDNPAAKKLILEAKSAFEKEVRSTQPSDMTQRRADIDQLFKSMTDLKASNLKIPQKFGTSAEDRMAEGQAIDQVQRMIKKYSDKTSTDAMNLDEALTKMSSMNANIPVATIKANLQDVSRNLDLAEKASSRSGLGGATKGLPGLLDKLQMSVTSKMLTGAEAAAKATNAVQDSYQKVLSYTPEQLTQLAGTVKNSSLANILTNAAKAPEAKRKALIFTLMQQPAYREMIEGE